MLGMWDGNPVKLDCDDHCERKKERKKERKREREKEKKERKKTTGLSPNLALGWVESWHLCSSPDLDFGWV